eukprot:298880-Chlamydomonas_euryale.AAC.1
MLVHRRASAARRRGPPRSRRRDGEAMHGPKLHGRAAARPPARMGARPHGRMGARMGARPPAGHDDDD